MVERRSHLGLADQACASRLVASHLGRQDLQNDIAVQPFIPGKAVNDPHFQVALQKAGHKLLLVHQADVLAEASKSGKYDIILVDLQDEAMVDKQVTTSAVNTVVMPVVYDGAELKTAVATQFRCVRKASGKNSSCFSTLDRAIESKLKRDELLRRASK